MIWLNKAKSYLGTKEIVGKENNPTIVKMYSNVGFPEVKDDETAWCAAFIGSVLKEAGYPHMKSLAARSYLKYGKKLTEPKEGCIVVFWRGKPDGWQGHVAFVTRFDDKWIWALGGNQSNAVTEQKFDRKKVLGYRWPVENATTKTSQDPKKEIIKTSKKLSVLQTIRNFGSWIIATIGGVFSLDTLGVTNTIVSGLKGFLTDNAIPIALGSIILFWFILKWVEKKSVEDYKEGRYTPSGMAEEVEVKDV
jgi:uncharacterized protein (TIGR02594 family)